MKSEHSKTIADVIVVHQTLLQSESDGVSHRTVVLSMRCTRHRALCCWQQIEAVSGSSMPDNETATATAGDTTTNELPTLVDQLSSDAAVYDTAAAIPQQHLPQQQLEQQQQQEEGEQQLEQQQELSIVDSNADDSDAESNKGESTSDSFNDVADDVTDNVTDDVSTAAAPAHTEVRYSDCYC
jgi:hypothetical protein